MRNAFCWINALLQCFLKKHFASATIFYWRKMYIATFNRYLLCNEEIELSGKVTTIFSLLKNNFRVYFQKCVKKFYKFFGILNCIRESTIKSHQSADTGLLSCWHRGRKISRGRELTTWIEFWAILIPFP